MKQEEFLQAMVILGTIYNKEFTEEQVAVWYEFFKDTNIKDLTTAIKRLGNTKKFLPSIAEIKEEIAYITTEELQLDVDVEWNNVLMAIRKYGADRGIEALESLKDYTADVVRKIGWYRLCMSENIHSERRAFKEIFGYEKEKLKQIKQVGIEALPFEDKYLLNDYLEDYDD